MNCLGDDTRDDFPLSGANTRESTLYPVIQNDAITFGSQDALRAFFTYLACLRDSDPCGHIENVERESTTSRQEEYRSFITFSAVRIIFHAVNSEDARSHLSEGFGAD